MVITMAGQLKQLLIMVIAGFCAAFFYDILRAGGRVFAQSAVFVGVRDILYWVLCAAFALVLIFRLNYGEIRAFMFLGSGIGAAVYFAVISPVFLKISVYLLRTALGAAGFVFYPFRIAAKLFSAKFEHFVNFFKKVLKKICTYGKIKTEYLYRSIGIIFKKH